MVNRIEPALGPEGYKTYQISSPRSSHTRPATCEEVSCLHHARGWITTVPTGSEDEALIRRAGRPFTTTVEGGMTSFRFEPGTLCFRASTHRVALERDPILLVRGGDWRGNPTRTPTRVHSRPADWVDDFAEHLARVEKDRS